MPPKAVDLLLAFIESDGRVVKEDLIKKVWADTAVTESSLTYHVHVLRDALGDTGPTPQYIETIPRRGYRFLSEVRVARATPPAAPRLEALPAADTSDAQEEAPSPSSDTPAQSASRIEEVIPSHRPRAPRFVFMALATIVLTLTLGVISLLPPPPVPRVTTITRLTVGAQVQTPELATDGWFVAFMANGGGMRIRLDQQNERPPRPVDAFLLLDVSLKRQEALALRPNDHGAENGLWLAS